MGHLARDCTVTDVEPRAAHEDRATPLTTTFESEKTGTSKTNCKAYLELRVVFVE